MNSNQIYIHKNALSKDFTPFCVENLFDLIAVRLRGNSSTSWLVARLTQQHPKNSKKLNSRPVYCSRLYGRCAAQNSTSECTLKGCKCNCFQLFPIMTEVNFLEMTNISDISMYKRDPWKFHPLIPTPALKRKQRTTLQRTLKFFIFLQIRSK